MKNYAISSGSVIGSQHTFLNKPNQDFHFLINHEDIAIGMVSDGCGSGVHSQFGSIVLCRVMENLFRKSLADFLRGDREELTALFHWLGKHTQYGLMEAINLMGLRDPVEAGKYMLATMLGFVLTDKYLVIFHCGDGYYRMESNVLHDCSIQFKGNAPPYFAYSLFPRQLPEYEDLRITFSVHGVDSLQNLLVSTDGIEEVPYDQLAELTTKDLYLKNPHALQRFLQKRAKEEIQIDFDNKDMKKIPALLKDDTTTILVRRLPGV